MNKIVAVISMGIFLFLININLGLGTAEASMKSSITEVQQTSQNVSLGGLIDIAEEYSIPILVVIVVVAAFMALLGIMFKPLKAAAGGLLGTGILFFILVNYAPQIAAILISIADGVMSRITGGA